MSKIPDDVIEKALVAYDIVDTQDDTSYHDCMRAAGDVFVEWALEEAAAYMEKTLPHLSLQEYAAAIRALKPKQDAQ